MRINFKQPKYILPLLLLPFLCLFFFVYHSGAAKGKKETKQLAGINTAVGDVSPEIKKRELEDKLDAYRDKYKDADGNSAVMPIPSEQGPKPADLQKKTLDSINQVLKLRLNRPTASGRDKALASALNSLQARQPEKPRPKEKDPMELFKQQLAYMDSIRKAGDPALQAAKKKKETAAKTDEKILAVRKTTDQASDFNTIRPDQNPGMITAVIDENVTGYAGSRIRLRLLEDIMAGNTLIKKGTYLYALISGFSAQRVTLAIKSILYDDKILPVKLEIYDMDGLPGLYVPASAFRDFTKDAATNTVQGVDIESSSTSFLMSTTDKLFESTSNAIAGIIRKDKAKLKYNSYIYLIDNKETSK